MALCLYEVLGLDRLATAEEVRKAYLSKALQWHPDRWVHADAAMGERAETCFKLVVEANSILSDPSKRAAYDALHARRSGASRPSTAQTSEPPRPSTASARSPYAVGSRASAWRASESAPADRPATASTGLDQHASLPAVSPQKAAALYVAGAGGSMSAGRPAQRQLAAAPRASLRRDASAVPAPRSTLGGASAPIAAEQPHERAPGSEQPSSRPNGGADSIAAKRRPQPAWRRTWPPEGWLAPPAPERRASASLSHASSAPRASASSPKAFSYPAQSASVGGKLRPRAVAQRERSGAFASTRIPTDRYPAQSASVEEPEHHALSPPDAALDAAQSRYFDYFGHHPRAAAVGRLQRGPRAQAANGRPQQ